MRRFARTLRPAIPALLAALVLPAGAPAAPGAVVKGIRHKGDADYARVVVDLSRETRYEVGSLPPDPSDGRPFRVFVDLFDVSADAKVLDVESPAKGGLVTALRAGRPRPGAVRVVVEVSRETTFRAFALHGPDRIIVDLDREAPRAAAAPAPRKKIRVMIDPGHGGKDPGATGASGMREKDVVLALGRLVRDRLGRGGEYEVLMTRDDDVFIPLEDRTAAANRAKADVFVSLHINASRDRTAEGISTYVLSHASDRQALEVAARENGVPIAKLTPVRLIINDLSTFPRKNESLKLGKTVNDALVREVSRRHGRVEDLGLKQAPFYVLMGARMTAVLVEASFISNRREEKRLSDPRYLGTLADAVVEAVRFYGRNGVLAARDGA